MDGGNFRITQERNLEALICSIFPIKNYFSDLLYPNLSAENKYIPEL